MQAADAKRAKILRGDPGASEPAEDEPIPFMNVDETVWEGMSQAEQVRRFEVEGFVVLPRVLDAAQIARLKSELAGAEMTHKSYSEKQTFAVGQPQWCSQAACELIGHPPTAKLLRALLGDDCVFTRGFYQRTLPGSPGISLHTDGQPHGSDIFGYEGSCPRLLRVLYYLDDLTPKRSPFRLVPRSHLSFHADANPYLRFKHHPDELTICVPAGSCIVMPAFCFHGTHPNVCTEPRDLLQYGYRPAWAGPIKPVDEWEEGLVAAAPECAKPFLQPLNTNGAVFTQPHKPQGMRAAAPSLDPKRWEDGAPASGAGAR